MIKKLLLIFIFMASTLFFDACSPAYVASQPLDNDEVRPHSPSNAHVWIGGNWKYNRASRLYNKGNGHWVMPRRGRTYFQGQWNSDSKGYYWIPGRWEKTKIINN